MISTEKELIEFLEFQFPLKKAEKWDFVGYSIKNKTVKKLKILICLDVNTQVVNRAIKEDFSLIISFHPFKFTKTWKEVFEYDFHKELLVNKLKKHKVNVYSMHTNFEQNSESLNYWLIKKLNWEKNIIKKYKFAFLASFNDTFETLIKELKYGLKINQAISNIENKSLTVKNIYFSPGAGNIYYFINNHDLSNVLITSDIKWHEQQLLNDLNYKFVMIPHKIEDVFNEALSFVLNKKLDKSVIMETMYFHDFLKGY